MFKVIGSADFMCMRVLVRREWGGGDCNLNSGVVSMPLQQIYSKSLFKARVLDPGSKNLPSRPTASFSWLKV